MGKHAAPLLVVAGLFLSLAAYLLLSTPSEEALALHARLRPTEPNAHPCPYADVLGLDENSVNPHTAGGGFPSMMGGLTKGAPPAAPVATAAAAATNTAASTTTGATGRSTAQAKENAATGTGGAAPGVAQPEVAQEQQVRTTKEEL